MASKFLVLWRLELARVSPETMQAYSGQPVFTEGFGGQHSLLCEVEVKKNRITTVTLSLAERPPRCQCRFNGSNGAADHSCVS